MINPDYIANLRPAQHLLDQCRLVAIADPAVRMHAMKTWCWENNLSLFWFEVLDTTDLSYTYDQVAGFYFIDEKDATMFTLKYK